MVAHGPNLDAWHPHARAMVDYFCGDKSATIVVHDDLGGRDEHAIAYFFREPADFPPLERRAIELCRGRVLDAGAGSGCHALALQARGISVCAIDVVPELVDIMRERGVRDVYCAAVLEFAPERFDTVLMLMNGIGVVESLEGLQRFLTHLSQVMAPTGQLLFDSTDLRRTSAEPLDDLDLTRMRRRDGRYAGEIEFQLEYGGQRGAPLRQLYVDPDTVARFASEAGWHCEVVMEADDGGYLARVTRPLDAPDYRTV